METKRARMEKRRMRSRSKVLTNNYIIHETQIHLFYSTNSWLPKFDIQLRHYNSQYNKLLIPVADIGIIMIITL